MCRKAAIMRDMTNWLTISSLSNIIYEQNVPASMSLFDPSHREAFLL